MSHSLTPLVHPLLAEHERQRCEVWTRVMGYHRPLASFNIGKQGEFAERRYFVAGRDAGAGPLACAPVCRPTAANPVTASHAMTEPALAEAP